MIDLSREKELEKLRIKIIDAIRFSKHYWMIFKEKTFGIATILDLIYKKSYIEVLFFTNYDVLESGVPILTINTPIETEVDLNEILLEPDFDKDGLISPKKIINKLNQLIQDEFQYHIDTLNQEVKLIKQRYENYEINNIPYNREIRIYFPQQHIFELRINFEKYPLMPNFFFSDNLSKIISVNEFLDIEMSKNWNPIFPIHIIKIIKELIKLVTLGLKVNALPKDSQHLLIEKVTVGTRINNISFKILRGQSIGIIYKENQFHPSGSEKSDILEFFDVLSGNSTSFTGIVKIFGKNVQLALKSELDRIKMISIKIDQALKNLTLKKVMSKDFDLIVDLNILKEHVDNLVKKSGISFIKSDLALKTLKKTYKKDIIDQILKDIGLLNRKYDKVKDLSTMESILFSISRALLHVPHTMLVLFPNVRLGRLEIEKFSNAMNKISKNYHACFIIHGTKEIVSICNQIINITPEKTEIGSVEDYIRKLPQSGEILTIELSQPNLNSLKQMFKLKSIIFIEQRRNEKYKLFIQENPENVIMLLLELFGSKLYNFKRFRATLGDYLEFLEYKKYGSLHRSGN